MLTPREEITSSFCEIYQAGQLKENCYQFVNHQFQNLHPVIRFGLFVFGLLFATQALIFRSQPLEQISAWQKSRLGLLRDFIYFYESLSVLYIFENKEAR